MGYVHFEVETAQSEKKAGAPCGDVCYVERTPTGTTIILSDGLGSGVKANIAATMCVARLKELMRCGFSMRRAFTNVATTMNQAAKEDLHYAVFTIVKILNDGVTSILSYDMPAPIFISNKQATILNQRTFTLENSVICEANCYLNLGDSILLVSDGITQAGLGRGLNYGWTSEGLKKFVSTSLPEGVKYSELPQEILNKAHQLCKGFNDDDASAVLAYSRVGMCCNVLTGPPAEKGKDLETVRDFINADGYKIVCGGTTANIVARGTGKRVVVDNTYADHFTPPKYSISGIDLVTEGAVTLNQLFNVIDEERIEMDDDNPVTELYDLVMPADRINFIVGKALNPAAGNISFVSRGLLSRQKIVHLLAEKLRSLGKLVSIEEV